MVRIIFYSLILTFVPALQALRYLVVRLLPISAFGVLIASNVVQDAAILGAAKTH